MSENNNKVVKLQGSIDLAALAGVQFLRIGLNKVPMICIPVKDNPSIFVPETKEGQRRKALLDVDIIPTPKSKYNTHMAKATVGKANLEKYGLDRNNKDAMAVAERPPPCTSTLRPGNAAKSRNRAASEDSSSTILPPTLIIFSCSFMELQSYK